METATGLMYAYPINTDGTLGTRVELGTGWNSVSELTGGTFNGKTGVAGIVGSTGQLVVYPSSGGTTLGTSTLSARQVLATGWAPMNNLTAVNGIPGDSGTDLVAVDKATGMQWLYHSTGSFAANGRSATGMDLYTSPAGGSELLAHQADGTWVLRESSGVVYTFAQLPGAPASAPWRLSAIADKDGRTQHLAYNANGTLASATDTASGRALNFTWNSSDTHIASVSTGPVAGSDQSTVLTWTYVYDSGAPDELDQVCAPPTGGNTARSCMTYSYTSGSSSGSHYRSTVMDASPVSYWRLDDPLNSASAASEVLANEGTDAATYTGVALGGDAGPLSAFGSPTTSATFNGTSSQITLPDDLFKDTYTSVGLWFKTTKPGVLVSYQNQPLGSKTAPGFAVDPLYIDTNGDLRGEFYGTAVGIHPITTSSAVDDGKWHYAVLSAAGNTQTLYLDGAAVGSPLLGQIAINSQTYASIGAGYTKNLPWPNAPVAGSDGNNRFAGQIAEVAVYDHALGVPTVAQQWQAATHAATELTGSDSPLGKTRLAVTYDPVNDRASQLTDANGGTWKLNGSAVSGSTQEYRGAVLASRPSGYWNLSDSSGTQAANQIYNPRPTPNNGTYSNVGLRALGPFPDHDGEGTTVCCSATFDGSTSSLQLPAANVPHQGPGSISLWFKTTTAGVLFSYQSFPIGSAPAVGVDSWNPALYVGTDGYLHGEMWMGNGGAAMVSSTKVNDGNWHFAVLNATSTTSQVLYLDGNQTAGPLAGTISPNGTAYAYVGAGATGGSWPSAPTDPDGHFNGQIAKVAVFPQALTTATIQFLNNQRSAEVVTYDSAITDAHPTGYWPLDDTSGNQAADMVSSIAAQQNQGHYTNTTGGVPGPWTSGSTTATGFDGTDSYVQLPPTVAPTGSSASVEVWFKTTSPGVLYSYQSFPLGAGHTIANFADSWNPALYIGTDHLLHGQLMPGEGPGVVSSGTPMDGKWHMAALVVSGGSQQLYLDGQPSGTPKTSTDGFLPAKSSYVYLGAGTDDMMFGQPVPTDASGHFNGALTDFASYDYALTPSAVAGHYSAATTADNGTGTDAATAYRTQIVQGAPDDYWRLDDPEGSSVAQDELGTALPDPYAGTYNDTTESGTGPSGNPDESGATFNGTDSSVALPASAAPTSGPASMELWFKTSTAGVLYSYQSTPLGGAAVNWNPALYVGTDGKLHGLFLDIAGHPSDSLTSTGTVNDNTWHQAALTATGTTETLYLDGRKQGAESSGTLQYNGGPYVYLGAGGVVSAWPDAPAGDSTSTSYFKGSIAEASYYPSTLDAATVAAHFQAMASSANPTPVTTATVTDPGGNTLTYQYDTDNGGRLLATTDAYGDTTRYGYDTSGYLDTVTDPDGHTTTNGHDAQGNVVSSTTCTDTSSCHTSFATYYLNTVNSLDPRNGEKLTSSDARSSSSSDTTYQTGYTYNTVGDLTDTRQPDGSTTHRAYTGGTESAPGGGSPPPGLLASTTDAMGDVTAYSYFSDGDLASTTNPSGLVTNYGYDNLGRITKKTVTCGNCAAALSTTVTDYTWDGQSNLLSQTDPATTDAVTGAIHTMRTSYMYDLDGEQTSQIFSDLTGGDTPRGTSWVYDAADDHVLKATDPLGRSVSYTYDAYGRVTSQTDAAGTRYTYAYSPMGQLQQTAISNFTGDPNSPVSARTQVLDSRAYDPAGRLATETDAMGRTTHTYYNDDGTVAEVDLDGFHNANGTTRDVVEETDRYDAAGNLISQSSGGGKSTTDLTYDVDGRTAGTTLDPGGLARTTTYSYNLNGQVSGTIQTGGGVSQSTGYAYTALGAVDSTNVKEATGNHITTVQFNQFGLPTSSVSPDGNAPGGTASAHTTYYAYDAAGQLTTTVLPPVGTEIYDPASHSDTVQQVSPIAYTGYDTFGDATSVKDPQGVLTSSGPQNRITTTTYDLDGEPVAVAEPAYTNPITGTTVHPVSTTGYDALGHPVYQTEDPTGLNQTIKDTYDQLGNVVSISLPDLNGKATTETSSYDLDGEQLSNTSATGAVAQATYDDLGRRITSTAVERYPAPQALTTRYTWDDAGDEVSSVEPGGGTTVASYDAAGEVLSVTDPTQHTTRTSYDGLGRAVSVAEPDGTTITAGYNALDQQVSAGEIDTTGVLARTAYTGYDLDGNTVSSTDAVASPADAAAHTTTFVVDALGRTTSQTEPVSAGSSITTSFGYDADGNRTRETNGDGNSTYFTYNSMGLGESTIDPPTAAHPAPADGTFTTGYDALGEATSNVEPGGVVRQTSYDSLGDLTGESASGGDGPATQRSLTYDQDGNLTSVSTPSGVADTYQYDDRGLLLQSAGPGGSSGYGYDADGNMVQRTDAAGTSGFTYNAGDQLTGMTDPLTGADIQYGYDGAGRLQSEQFGTGGGSRAFAYDTLGRLKTDTVKNPAGSAISSIGYGYNTDDQVTGKTTTGTAGAAANTYGYDLAGRLTSWNNGTSTTAYTWDAAGNRTSAGGQAATYDARDELLTDGTTSYTYTARGTLSSSTTQGGSTTQSQYDSFDRMIAEGSVTYSYDSLDRIAQTVGRNFTYDGGSDNLVSDGLALYSRQPDGTLVASAGLSGTTATDPQLSIADLHGDVVADLSPTSSSLTGSTDYDPFGQRVASSGGASGNLGYQGGWTDPATGQVNMSARWYQPSSGTFTSRDSATADSGPAAQSNRYSYGNDDPLDQSDPSGHNAICDAVWETLVGLVLCPIIFPTQMQPEDTCPALNGVNMCPGSIQWNQYYSRTSANCFIDPGLCDPGYGGGSTTTGYGVTSGSGRYSLTRRTDSPGVPLLPVFNPAPVNKRPHIHSDPLSWIKKAVTHTGVGILTGLAKGVVGFTATGVGAVGTLVVGTGTAVIGDILTDLTSDPQPTPMPDPEPDPGPLPPRKPKDEQERRKTCLAQRPPGAESNGSQEGWTYYAPTGPDGRAEGAVACMELDTSGGTKANPNSPGMSEAKERAKSLFPNAASTLVNSCHLIPKALGGRGVQANTTPCWATPINVGDMTKIQSFVAANLKMRDYVVEMRAKPYYSYATGAIPLYYRYDVDVYTRDGRLVNTYEDEIFNSKDGYNLDGSNS
ncbi:LamG-like jellyroll fold domain-containing protein [Streptacidiphilus cavernicola]|uniref:LamG-like jellyroll fold domain-containing protein n=1 Tax=Streptacidiphilus cavernicola TaxID=3342716 RepID=A0ABV6W5Y2_9ACTN